MKEKLDIVIQACEDKIGKDITTIKLDEGQAIGEYFVIVTGSNTNQTQAICDEIEDKWAENGLEILGKEGYREGKWILLDLNDIIVHIFTEEDRDYYDLERLWSIK